LSFPDTREIGRGHDSMSFFVKIVEAVQIVEIVKEVEVLFLES